MTTFEEAREQLRQLTVELNADRIPMAEWQKGVHDVIAAFEKSRTERTNDLAPLAAPALPGEADPAETGAVQAGLVRTHGDPVNRHTMLGHAS